MKLARECQGYVASQFFPGEPLGATVRGFRNEDLEALSFPDAVFDLTVTLDVMEHVNQPDVVLREVARTLKPGGAYLFTVPTYKARVASERRAHYRPDGTVEHLAEPEYHGNPVSDAGSLVTFHYGYDFAELIHAWSGLDVEVARFHDHRHGVIGDFTEVYLARDARRADQGRRAPAGLARLAGHEPGLDALLAQAADQLVHDRVVPQDLALDAEQVGLDRPLEQDQVDELLRASAATVWPITARFARALLRATRAAGDQS